jgi:D-alanyl-D-alanine carboxypeptidase
MNFKLFILLIAGFLTLASQEGFGQKKFNPKKLDSLLKYFSSNNKMMGSLTISKAGNVQYHKALGFSFISQTEKIPVTVETKYRIGSLTKMFTAAMILQLVEEKKLSLENHLSAYIPEIPNAKRITISNLLNHRSGLFNYTGDENFPSWSGKPITKEEMISILSKEPIQFEPDEKAEYSNTNYLLLGYIIEKITGKSYSSELQSRIIKRAGLKNTYVGEKTYVEENESFSYLYFNKAWNQEEETDMSIPGGAGSIVSTPDDLTKFIDALFTGKLLQPSLLSEMLFLKDGYGKGIFRMPFYNNYSYGHTGKIDGFHSSLCYFPSDSVSIAFCSNGMNYEMNDLLIGILSIYYNKPYKFPSFKTITLPETQLLKYEGIYSSTQMPLKITIKKEDGVLTAQATGQSSFPLETKSDTEFRFDAAGIVIIFNKSGEDINEFTLKQGENYLFKKEK